MGRTTPKVRRNGTQARKTTLVVRAAKSTPPKGVTMPPRQPSLRKPTFGFVDNAERMNSRAAMMGFFILLAIEGVTGKGLLELAGFKIGEGLDLPL